jgi:hypothetical protein
MVSIGEGDYLVVKKEPCVVHGLVCLFFMFFRELQKIWPPARKKTGGKLWAGPPSDDFHDVKKGLSLLNVCLFVLEILPSEIRTPVRKKRQEDLRWTPYPSSRAQGS